MRIVCSLLLATLALAARADGIYKWVDEDGVVHFGEQPPRNEQAEVIKKPRSERYKLWQAQQAKQQLFSDDKPKAEPQTDSKPVSKTKVELTDNAAKEAEDALRAQRCWHAQQTLRVLKTNARVREEEANGNLRILAEEERQQRMQAMQQEITNNC
ncbi:MAG: DUF4124 domain-containing protein [Gammaproteobacteria bacterium]|nr:DUF4124 domain-containing protein [Gammaproteobacteria bacterium]